MEREDFHSGYCRAIDQSRMVTTVLEDGELLEVDCGYPQCVHAPNCPIAQKIRELLEED